MPDQPPLAPEVPAPRRKRRWLRWIAGSAFALVLLLALGYAYLGSQAALEFALARAVTASAGRLTIEGAEGSLLSTVRLARLAWRGDELDVEARELALAWNPIDLVSRQFTVTGLGAKRITLTAKPAPGSTSRLPEDLALPLEVNVRNVGVERLEWQAGERGGAVTGITFGYRGGARMHAVRDLRFVTDNGTLTGTAELGATAPFAVRGALHFEGDGQLRGARAALTVAGALERFGVDVTGTLRDARVTANAVVTPFAAAPIVSADVDAQEVDLARFHAALPATQLTLKLAARPIAAGFAGTLQAQNAAAGTIDAGRAPLEALTARFAWEANALTLDQVEARLPGNGRATGRVTVPLGGGPVALQLALSGVDLARLHTSLLPTRLSGTLAADVAEATQTVRADLRQAELSLAFAATVDGTRVTIERFRAEARGGELAGSGHVRLDGARAFGVTARARGFDPSRFAGVPPGRLDGVVALSGTLAPTWEVTADVTVASGSQFAGSPVSGTARARVAPNAARDIAVDARVASAAIVLSGAFGKPSDQVTFALDAPRVAHLRPLLARMAPNRIPELLGGSLRARGSVVGDPRNLGFAIDAHGESLQWGRDLRAARIDVKASTAPGTRTSAPGAVDVRPIGLTVTGTGVELPYAKFATLRAEVAGTIAQHQATLAATGSDFDLAAAATGGLRETRRSDGSSAVAWSGTLDTFRNRGTYAVALTAPAALEIAPNRFHARNAHIAIADGHADLVELTVDDGRLATRGTFTGIPAAALARLAGTKLPFASTLTLGGEWALAASPRLNGSLAVRRERGDWFATESETLDPTELALGITQLDLSARVVEDALRATAQLRSTRAGQADATLTLAASAAPGQFSTDAALAATLKAELASLRPLQPWLGTAAVLDGRVSVDLAARGSLANPVLAGTLNGDALRFDLPQYGVHLREGRMRARLAERTLVLDEFAFTGGAGKFVAQGSMALAPPAAGEGAAAARLEWRAEDFTLVNRPDLRIVADGKGTLALANRKLALAGSVSIDEGYVNYAPTTEGRLSDDVVIVGQPRQPANAIGHDLPLTLDLEVALGRNFRFTGEGIDTGLAGSVRVRTGGDGRMVANGTIRAVAGTFFVFGQRLVIDRGRLIFDGPIDNPALDVVALRKNLAVEAGVEISGTVRLPRVRLVSNPPVPDGEKLAWLITGQGLSRASGAELAALSAASASLLGRGQRPVTTRIAETFGLDDISIHGSNASATASTSGQVVAFGKRISDRLTLVYEQGLTIATNALRIEYALTRVWTLRAEAGTVSSVGVFFRRSFD